MFHFAALECQIEVIPPLLLMIEFAPLANNSIPAENLANFTWIWISPHAFTSSYNKCKAFLDTKTLELAQFPFEVELNFLASTYFMNSTKFLSLVNKSALILLPHLHTSWSQWSWSSWSMTFGHDHEVEDDKTSYMHTVSLQTALWLWLW